MLGMLQAPSNWVIFAIKSGFSSVSTVINAYKASKFPVKSYIVR